MARGADVGGIRDEVRLDDVQERRVGGVVGEHPRAVLAALRAAADGSDGHVAERRGSLGDPAEDTLCALGGGVEEEPLGCLRAGGVAARTGGKHMRDERGADVVNGEETDPVFPIVPKERGADHAALRHLGENFADGARGGEDEDVTRGRHALGASHVASGEELAKSRGREE